MTFTIEPQQLKEIKKRGYKKESAGVYIKEISDSQQIQLKIIEDCELSAISGVATLYYNNKALGNLGLHRHYTPNSNKNKKAIKEKQRVVLNGIIHAGEIINKFYDDIIKKDENIFTYANNFAPVLTKIKKLLGKTVYRQLLRFGFPFSYFNYDKVYTQNGQLSLSDIQNIQFNSSRLIRLGLLVDQFLHCDISAPDSFMKKVDDIDNKTISISEPRLIENMQSGKIAIKKAGLSKKINALIKHRRIQWSGVHKLNEYIFNNGKIQFPGNNKDYQLHYKDIDWRKYIDQLPDKKSAYRTIIRTGLDNNYNEVLLELFDQSVPTYKEVLPEYHQRLSELGVKDSELVAENI